MFFSKPSRPHSEKLWLRKQTTNAFVFLLLVLIIFILLMSTSIIALNVLLHFGLTIWTVAIILDYMLLLRNKDGFYAQYCSSFGVMYKKPVPDAINRYCIIREVCLVLGCLLLLLGVVLGLSRTESFVRQNTFEGTEAPYGYTWVIFNSTHDVPENGILLLRIRGSSLEFFPQEIEIESDEIGFLIPIRYYNPRRFSVVVYLEIENLLDY